MVLRKHYFRRRRRVRWRKRKDPNNNRGLWTRLREWWNRHQFYTFHKDEMITQKRDHSFPQPKSYKEENDDEWNNESESGEGDEKEVDEPDFEGVDEEYSSAELVSDQIETLVTIDEDSPLEDSPRLGSKPKINPTPPKPPPRPAPTGPTPPSALKLYRNGTIDSLSGSLESLDSLVESQWDPEDDSSNVTPLVTNIHQTTDVFFVEHVRFLQIQTQPRKVEEVYNKGNRNPSEALSQSK